MGTLKSFVVAALILVCAVAVAKDEEIPAKVITVKEIPTWYHEGLHFDGRNIWVANGLKGKIWIVDPESGKVLRDLVPPGTFTEAVTSGGKDLYVLTDWDAEKIYTARAEGGRMRIEKEVPLKNTHPAGIVSNGRNFFVITWTRSLAGTKFDVLKLDSGFNVIKSYRINDIQEPSQIAWDGRNLWISSWYDRRIYRMDPDTMGITGYIKSPVKKTTGIAWDGKTLWVTGTYSDLYKMELQN
jgi:sugar lactone lactonase YvrE